VFSHKFSSHPRAMVYPRATYSNFVGHGSINYELVGPTIITLGLCSRSLLLRHHMRYGLVKLPVCIFLKFGVVRFM
jgi:hypothetical protein